MNISVCITVKNEEETISKLLDSLINQTKKCDEIVIVDGGSTDKTIELIKHYQKRHPFIKVLQEKVSRSKGRNIGIEIAKNEIIALTDAGCVADRNWLNHLTAPFVNKEVEVVAGFYKMVYKNDFEKAETRFLGVTPDKYDFSFLPSSRSMAFRKSVWEKVGGFPEKLNDTAEDTYFNYKLLKNGVKIARVKNAIVEWGMPETLNEFFNKIYSYAKGDAKTKIIIFPTKNITSHNIKAFLILLRYTIGLLLFIFSLINTSLFPILIILIFIYLFWAFIKAGYWGIVLQITSDIGVISGFLMGVWSDTFKSKNRLE